MMPNTPPTIHALRVRVLRVPLAQPHQTAGGTVSESPLVLTDITTSEGVVGHSVVDYNQCLTPVEAALARVG